MGRLVALMTKLNLEPLSRKEVYFYNHLQPFFNKQGIRTPNPLYVALEDHGDLPMLFNLMGFQNDFRGVIMMEDIGHCENFPIGTPIPEKYAMASAVKLSRLHALNWYQPMHPNFPSDYAPDAYIHFFNFNQINFFTANLNKSEMIERLDWWKLEAPYIQESPIREALISFSSHKDLLLKYHTNNKLQSSRLFQHLTFLHGDFHSGNLLFITQDPEDSELSKFIKEIVICDWQCFGYGHPSTEFSYFINNVEFDPERDLKNYENLL